MIVVQKRLHGAWQHFTGLAKRDVFAVEQRAQRNVVMATVFNYPMVEHFASRDVTSMPLQPYFQRATETQVFAIFAGCCAAQLVPINLAQKGV